MMTSVLAETCWRYGVVNYSVCVCVCTNQCTFCLNFCSYSTPNETLKVREIGRDVSSTTEAFILCAVCCCVVVMLS